MHFSALMKNEATEACETQIERPKIGCEKTNIATLLFDPGFHGRHVSTSTLLTFEGEGASVSSMPPEKTSTARDSYRLEVRDALEAALEVCNDLTSGKSLIKVAASKIDDNIFGMGHMLYALPMKKILPDQNITPAEIIELACIQDFITNDRPTINRHRLIATLKEANVFNPAHSDRIYKPAGTTPSLRDIMHLVEDISLRRDKYHLTFDHLTSSSRTRDLVNARYYAIWAMRNVCGHSLSLIGTHLGNRDHTTILNSINNTVILRQKNNGVKAELEQLCENADMVGVENNREILRRQA